MIQSQTLFFALAGGILPVLAWLWFWLREDSINPEPRWILTLVFVIGMFSALVAYPFELFSAATLGVSMDQQLTNLSFNLLISLVFSWAAIEELLKYAMAYITILYKKYTDEPVDMLIYMIVVALGFAAMENSLFLFGPLASGDLIGSITTGNIRFVGSTLLHTMTAAIIGIPMAITFYRSRIDKIIWALVGTITAIILHTLFNLFILKGNGTLTLVVFSVVWLSLIVTILFFEKIKKLTA